MEVSGGEAGRLGSCIAHTANRVAAYVRSSDREAAEKEFAVMQPRQTPEHPWIAEARAEQAKKEAERQAKIKSGRLIIHPDGSFTEKLPPRW